MKSQPPSYPLQHDSFHKIRTPTVNKHARLVEKRTSPDIETSEAFPASKRDPADFVKLEEENPNMAATMMYLMAQRAAKQTRLGLGTVQNQIHPGSLGWPSGRHNPKVNLPRSLEKFTRKLFTHYWAWVTCG